MARKTQAIVCETMNKEKFQNAQITVKYDTNNCTNIKMSWFAANHCVSIFTVLLDFSYSSIAFKDGGEKANVSLQTIRLLHIEIVVKALFENYQQKCCLLWESFKCPDFYTNVSIHF